MNMYHLANKRTVHLVRLVIDATYSGYQSIGDWSEANATILNKLPARAIKLLQTDVETPVSVSRPENCQVRLPEFVWIAEFKSFEPHTDPDTCIRSSLCLCWFTDQLNVTVDALIQSALNSCDWEPLALRYKWEP